MNYRNPTLSRISSGGKKGKTRYVCQLCTRTLDDCLFADEVTKKITPFCKTCRHILQERKDADFFDAEDSSRALSNRQSNISNVSEQIQSSPYSTELEINNDPTLYTANLIRSYVKKERKRKQRCLELSVGVVPSPKWILQWNNAEFQSSLYIATALYHRSLDNTNILNS